VTIFGTNQIIHSGRRVIAAFIATCFASSTPAVIERAREYCQRGQRSNSNQHSRAFPARSEPVRVKQHTAEREPTQSQQTRPALDKQRAIKAIDRSLERGDRHNRKIRRFRRIKNK
jgi:hypothetical protein